MWERLSRIPQKNPFLFSVGLTTIKTGVVDYLVQRYVEKKDVVDWRRVRIFTTFGFCFSGMWQYWLFTKYMPMVVPGAAAFASKPIGEKLKDAVGLKGLVIQNFIENGVNNPFLFWPVFYTMKEHIEGGPLINGVRKYRKHWRDDLVSIWAVWVPAQFVNLAFSPLWLRVPFMAAVSAGWITFVSITRGGVEADEES